MKKDGLSRELFMEILVGGFVVLIFLGIGMFTVVLSKQKWFADVYPMQVEFADIMGLGAGDSVVVRGMQVGTVSSLALATNRVVVSLELDSDIPVRVGYEMKIMPSSVLGGQYLHIDQGPLGAPELSKGVVYRGSTPIDLVAEAATLVRDVRSALFEEGILDDLKSAMENFREVSERVNGGQGFVGRLLSDDDSLYRDLSNTVSSVSFLSETLVSGSNSVARLLNDDGRVYESLADTFASLKDVSERLNAGKGTMGRLLSDDDTVYRDLSEALASLRNVAEKIESGEGALGKLATDDSLYEELESLVGEARATLDDVRESSPIVTFTSVFFGAF